jgi:hypothetical protein
VATPDDFEISGMIFKAYCDVITWTQTMLKEQLAETIGSLVELLIGDYLRR